MSEFPIVAIHREDSSSRGRLRKWGLGCSRRRTQRVYVGIWYILRAPRGPHIPTLRAKYIPKSYMDPLEKAEEKAAALRAQRFFVKALRVEGPTVNPTWKVRGT